MMEEAVNLVSNVGFPIVVALYLLIRFEPLISKNTEAINKLGDIVEKLCIISNIKK